MYNKEQKELFISGFTRGVSRREAAYAVFQTVSKYEDQWCADICTKSKEELQPVIDEIVGLRSSSKKLRLSILKEYARWCKNVGIDGACDGLLEIKDVGVGKIKQQMVASPRHLQKYLNSICDKESLDTVDCTCRCFFWLAYSGIKEEDAFRITKDNIDLSELLISLDGFTYPIYREARETFKKCISLDSFRYIHPNCMNEKVLKPRIEGDSILRGIQTNSLKSMRVIISRKCRIQKNRSLFKPDDKEIDIRPSYYTVWLSGLFYKMYELEGDGNAVDFTDAAEKHMLGTTYKLDSGRNTIDAKKRQIMKEYNDDYIRWKEAFSF